MVILIVLSFVIIAVSISWYRDAKRIQVLSDSPLVIQKTYQLKPDRLASPEGVYFSPTHSWAYLQSNGDAKVGVDAFLNGLTGILSEITLPEKGQRVKQGDPMFRISQEGKTLVISAPISGTIKKINHIALQNLSIVHRDPYTAGWLAKLEPSNWEVETQRLYRGPRTLTWLKAEITRIRDFFAHSFAPPHAERGLALLQEGGDIADGALAYAGKGLWGSFQKLILDPSNQELTQNS
jgi:glycine cleavage system H lipoate-binding protein